MHTAAKYTTFTVTIIVIIVICLYVFQTYTKSSQVAAQLEISDTAAEMIDKRRMRISWSDVPYATSFEIYIGKTMAVSPDAHQQKIIATTNPVDIVLDDCFDPRHGVYYTIVARRVTDDGDVLSSEMTSAASTVQVCRILPSPEIDFSSIEDGIAFTSWLPVAGAEYYHVYLGDIMVDTEHYVRKEVVKDAHWFTRPVDDETSYLIVAAVDECGEGDPSAAAL
jgi:hypothetical protein